MAVVQRRADLLLKQWDVVNVLADKTEIPGQASLDLSESLRSPFLTRRRHLRGLASRCYGDVVDHLPKLPHTLQTYATLYGAWVQGLRSTAERRTVWSRIRRRAKLVVLDAALCAVIVIAGSLSARGLAQWAGRVAGVGPAVARVARSGPRVAFSTAFESGHRLVSANAPMAIPELNHFILRLHLPERWPWQTAWTQLITRVSDPPTAVTT